MKTVFYTFTVNKNLKSLKNQDFVIKWLFNSSEMSEYNILFKMIDVCNINVVQF